MASENNYGSVFSRSRTEPSPRLDQAQCLYLKDYTLEIEPLDIFLEIETKKQAWNRARLKYDGCAEAWLWSTSVFRPMAFCTRVQIDETENAESFTENLR